MWLLAYVPAVLGILRYRRLSYWRWVGAIFLWQAAAQFLFASFGSLEHPERDGLIIRAVRQATDNGPAVAIIGLVFIVVFWGGIIYFLRQLFKDARQPAAGAYQLKSVSGGRKAVELIALTAVMGLLLYSNIAAMKRPAVASERESLESILDRQVAALNEGGPTRVDEITVLTKASREADVLVVEYAVSLPEELATRDTFEAALHERQLPMRCSEEATLALLQIGAKVRLRYTIPNAEPVALDISVPICDALAAQNSSSITR